MTGAASGGDRGGSLLKNYGQNMNIMSPKILSTKQNYYGKHYSRETHEFSFPFSSLLLKKVLSSSIDAHFYFLVS